MNINIFSVQQGNKMRFFFTKQ